MIKRVFLIFLILAIAASVMAETSLKCSLCGKSIKGQYVIFDDGDVFCSDCMEKYTNCDICGKPARKTVLIDGKNICRNCLIELDICSFCKKPIAGKYVYYSELNLKLCEKCAKTVPRCDICGCPDKSLVKVGHKRICRSCLKNTSICYTCGEPILGKYSWFDSDTSKKYCQKCVAKYSRCASCGAPVGKDSVVLDDDRILCRDCYRAGYFDPGKITPVKKKILAYMETSLGMTIKHDVKYLLQGQKFIEKKSEGISGDLNGLFYRLNNTFEIYILYGLRKKDLYQVIPHEIAHAWSAENCRTNLTLEEEEGFAQWVAYHALGHFGYMDYRETLIEGDNVYARGLRKMLAIEKRSGKQAVFEYLIKK